MRSVSMRLVDLQKCRINIGFVGENEHTVVLMDCKRVFDDYPNAVASLTVRPPRGDAYPAAVTRDGDIVSWVVSDSDLIWPGVGDVQYAFTENGKVVKSFVGKTLIERSIAPTGLVPTPIQNWIDQANEILEGIPAEISESVDTALSEAKASGEFDGDDGYSPTVAVSEITGGHRVTITDAEGDHPFDVMDGQDADPSQYVQKTEFYATEMPVSELDDTKVSAELSSLKNQITQMNPEATASDIGKALLVKTVADGKPTSWEYGEAGGGASDYDDLTDKPQINSVTLAGNKSLSDLGIHNVPAGGASGKVLKKTSSGDYAIEWGDVQTATDQQVTTAVDAYLAANFSNPSNPPLDRTLLSSSSAAPADMVGGLKKQINDVMDSVGFAVYTTTPGYFGVTGAVTSPTANKEVYTTKIPVVTGSTTFAIECEFSESKAQWLAMCQYKSDGTFINRSVLINETASSKAYEIKITNANCASVAFCWRTYDEDAVTIKFTPNELHDSIIDIYANEGKYAWFYALLEQYKYDSTNSVWVYDDLYWATRTVQYTSEQLVISSELTNVRFSIATAQADGTITNISSWAYYTVTIPANTYYYFLAQKTGSGAFALDTFVSNVFINGNKPQSTLTGQVDNALIGGADAYRKATTVWNWRNSHVKSINHRGYNKTAPEDTIPAYKLSKEKGFNYVETDIAFTSDDVAVLLHDASINRTGRNADGTSISGTVYIYDITYEQALDYDFGIWKDVAYAGTKIPTFDQFISLCRNIGLHPYIELKANGGYTQEQIISLVAIVKKYGMLRNVTWISFEETYLEYIKSVDAKARLGYICNEISDSVISTAQSLMNGSNEVFLDASKDYLTDALIKDCMDADIPLEVWSVNAPNAILDLNPYISGVSSDYTVAWQILCESELLY